MLFNSYVFIFIFVPSVFAGFFLLARLSTRLAGLWLAFASLFFYGWWNPRYVPLLIASIAFNYVIGGVIGRARAAKSQRPATLALITGICGNIALLGYFKYANFFLKIVNPLFGTDLGGLNIILPLGISFFTFTQIAFLVDTYRGMSSDYDPWHYLLFVTYFPHLIAGPILHHKQMMPQFSRASTYRLNLDNVNFGMTMFTIGLFKKVVLADQFALVVTPVFDSAAHGVNVPLIEAWLGTLAYSLQLYFDFSGYCDMAIGVSKIFNIDLPVNFDSPYKSKSIIEFWRRWHMTLSAFLRDYLYFPLVGKRKGPVRRYTNLMTTMVLGGLWHGASWTFVLWGGLHGFYLIVNHAWQAFKHRWQLDGIPWRWMPGHALTFLAIVVAWVPFRAADFEATASMLRGLAGINGVALPSALKKYGEFLATALPKLSVRFTSQSVIGDAYSAASWIAIGLVIVIWMPNSQQIMNFGSQRERSSSLFWKPTLPFALMSALGFLVAILMVGSTKVSEFLYFQF